MDLYQQSSYRQKTKCLDRTKEREFERMAGLQEVREREKAWCRHALLSLCLAHLAHTRAAKAKSEAI